MADVIDAVCSIFLYYAAVLLVLGIIFHNPISDFLHACAQAKRNQEEHLKLIDKFLKKKLEEEYHDTD